MRYETTTVDSLQLDQQLCFALYAASRSLTAGYRPLLDPLGLTYPQYLVMLVLWERDGLSVSELGSRLLLDSGTLTPLLKRLQQAGLLQRHRRQRDEREVQIDLTPHGRELRQHAVTIPACMFDKLGLSLAQFRQLQIHVRQLTAHLHSPQLDQPRLTEPTQ